MTKDSDFVRLQQELGPPPQLIWLTFGNTSNAHLKQILTRSLGKALEFIQAGETQVEVQRATESDELMEKDCAWDGWGRWAGTF
jgi:predicted nuclease of predicted toxin-antitoxin system